MLRQNFALQAVPSDCSSTSPSGSICERSSGPMLSRHVVATCVFSIYPPGEVDQELLKGASQKIEIGAAIDPEHRERGPRLNRRIHVSEIPFIRRQLAVRVHVPFARQQQQLMLCC